MTSSKQNKLMKQKLSLKIRNYAYEFLAPTELFRKKTGMSHEENCCFNLSPQHVPKCVPTFNFRLTRANYS